MIKRGFADFIIPISMFIHLAIINSVLYLMTPDTFLHLPAILFYNFSWLFITSSLNFYPTGRQEYFFTNIKKVFHLFLIYGLTYFCWFAFTEVNAALMSYQLKVYGMICLILISYRWFFFFLLRNYRLKGGNYVNVIVIGSDKNLKKLRGVFDNPYFGYRYCGFFDDTKYESPAYLGKVLDCFKYIIDHNIDEMYCTAAKLEKKELENLINFADNNLIKLKVIPDNKDIFAKAMSIQNYDRIPVIDLRTVPLDTEIARVSKRAFDLLFSTLVIVFLLSWLIPILALLIKWESPGPVFFSQKRHGLKRRLFLCYKLRSMTLNNESNSTQATKNDVRITRIGKILRKTSLDELPQFFNVFLGDMSVVGPRPHMVVHTRDYSISVNKYLVRHFVKPGITGLAQIRGYRGEIKRPSDILNRIKLDIFYVEKWSLGLDLAIISKTITNVLNGEEKAC